VKRSIMSWVVATAIAVAPLPALAETNAPQQPAPLAAGNAAGVKEAQGFGNVPWLFWAGGALVLVFAVLVLATNDDDVSTSTTTTTAP
jgi:hypothetical protein